MLKQTFKFFSKQKKYTQKDLKKNPLLDIVITRDFFAAYIGLVIRRQPIFWAPHEMEVQNYEATDIFLKTNDFDIPAYPENYDFTKKEYLDYKKGIIDNQTHRIKEGDKIKTYRKLSKYFKNVDPNVKDNSIQHEGCSTIYFIIKERGKWQFPVYQMNNIDPITIQRNKSIKKNSFQGDLLCYNDFPSYVQRQKMEDHDIEQNKYLEKCEGKKIFYFDVLHDLGELQWKNVEDFKWIAKHEFQDYLDKDDLEFFKVLPSQVINNSTFSKCFLIFNPLNFC